jgi:hypothetical protein
MSSSLLDRPGLQASVVSAITFDEALAHVGGYADIVKFDIEGAEYEAFLSSHNLSSVSMFIGEVHPDLFLKSPEEFDVIFRQHRCTRIVLNEGRYILVARQ